MGAESIELLSERGDKHVELVEDINGNKFVRRSYSKAAMKYFERRGVPFVTAWGVMHEIFDAVDIPVVSSFLLPPSGIDGLSTVVVSEYLEDGDVGAVSKDAKVHMATGLGMIPHIQGDYLPGIETFMPDMFRVGKVNGLERLILVDVDPYLDEKVFVADTKDATDIWNSEYIKRVGPLFWDRWTQPSDRRVVMAAFIRSFAAKFDFDANFGSRTFHSVANVQAMSQGLNLGF